MVDHVLRPGHRLGGEVVAKVVVVGHADAVMPGGVTQRPGEGEGRLAVLVAVVVDELQEGQLLDVRAVVRRRDGPPVLGRGGWPGSGSGGADEGGDGKHEAPEQDRDAVHRLFPFPVNRTAVTPSGTAVWSPLTETTGCIRRADRPSWAPNPAYPARACRRNACLQVNRERARTLPRTGIRSGGGGFRRPLGHGARQERPGRRGGTPCPPSGSRERRDAKLVASMVPGMSCLVGRRLALL